MAESRPTSRSVPFTRRIGELDDGSDQFADCNTPGIAVVTRTLSGEQVTQHISPHSPDAWVELVLDQREIVLRLSCGRRDLEAEQKARRAEGRDA